VKRNARTTVKPMNTEPAIIDATELILGRAASVIAKRLLQGETIVIVNAEKAAISGKRLSIIKEAKTFLEVGHPRKGPLHRRRPDQIVRRTVRGMLPWKKPKGKQAYKRLTPAGKSRKSLAVQAREPETRKAIVKLQLFSLTTSRVNALV